MSLPQSQAERLWRQIKLSHDRAMKIWPLNSLYFVIFLVIGFLATLPFVLGVAGDFWWISLPILLAWTAVLWIWGLPFVADTPEEARRWSISEKIGATLIMLGESLVGGVLAVFLVGFLIQQWFATILAILIMAVVIFWFGRDPPKPKLGDRAKEHERRAEPQPAPQASHQSTWISRRRRYRTGFSITSRSFCSSDSAPRRCSTACGATPSPSDGPPRR